MVGAVIRYLGIKFGPDALLGYAPGGLDIISTLFFDNLIKLLGFI